MTLLYVFLVLLVLSFIPVGILTVRSYLRFRGTRLITCPENCEPAAVRVDKGHAAATTIVGGPELRLESCTRWPEKQQCGQECLTQIESAPAGCLVRNILAHWYDGASCAICGQPIPAIHGFDNKPALLAPDGKTVEWDDVAPERLPAVLSTHYAVCWNCHIAKTFHDQFPDRVIDLPASSEHRVS